jgi:hypothetical protein
MSSEIWDIHGIFPIVETPHMNTMFNVRAVVR